MLIVDDLTVTYGAPPGASHAASHHNPSPHNAVSGVSFELPASEVLAVLGPSGCGKSTLLRALAGLEHPRAGTVTFDEEDLTHVPTHRRGFALLFQDGQLFSHLSVADNVVYPLKIRGVGRARRMRRSEELLQSVGLGGYGARQPGTLSGGEQQRVALARALAIRPRLLLLDEPLSALDRDLRERLAHELRAVLKAERTTAIWVTHDHEEAFAVADRLAVMREGRLVQTGSIEEVWRHPADAATARFLGYARVVGAHEAAALLEGAEGAPYGQVAGRALALRRSALRVDPTGQMHARVRSARQTPEQTRLVVWLAGLGELDAVAPLSARILVGDEVRLGLDRTRVALLPVADVDGREESAEL